MKIRVLRVLGAVIVLVLIGYLMRDRIQRWALPPQAPPSDVAGKQSGDGAPPFTVVATGLEVPWELVFLPDSSMLITERPGRLTHISGLRRRSYEIEGVRHVGEGGLLGLALHPRFAQNGLIYVYFTGFGGSGFRNRIVRYRFSPSAPGSGLSDRTVIIDNIPASPFHDGGRIAFGPDGYLYVTTGDATDASYSQSTESLGGKILRLADDGRPAPGNPFGNAVYSMGHRNAEGLAWDDRGRLWVTEHGRSGMESGLDELNLVEPGANYGWPSHQGDAVRPGVTAPVVHSGPTYTWAPSGTIYWKGRILFGGLRGEALYEARISDDAKMSVRAHFHAELGRIRVVKMGPDGMLYLGTSNRDGRGAVNRGDDRIVRMDPAFFDQP